MDKNEFLIKFIKFSGWLEIIFGIIFLFVDPFMQILGIPNFSFWNWFAGVTLFYMGVLLLYSGKDLEKFKIIPIVSSIFRFTMVVASMITAIIEPRFMFMVFISIYDFGSALLTLILIKQCGYLK